MSIGNRLLLDLPEKRLIDRKVQDRLYGIPDAGYYDGVPGDEQRVPVFPDLCFHFRSSFQGDRGPSPVSSPPAAFLSIVYSLQRRIERKKNAGDLFFVRFFLQSGLLLNIIDKVLMYFIH